MLILLGKFSSLHVGRGGGGGGGAECCNTPFCTVGRPITRVGCCEARARSRLASTWGKSVTLCSNTNPHLLHYTVHAN